MPKKLATNPKALEARARKEEKKQKDHEEKIRQEEDAKWKVDDKDVLRKQQRKEEQERKKQEAAQRKAENKALYEEEMGKVASKGSAAPTTTKVTRATIDKKLEAEKKQRLQEQQERETLEKKKISIQELPEDNVNRLEVEGEEARTVEEAISILSVSGTEAELDRHPEKRLRAAYNAFEEVNLPRLKQENPNLRLSQLKQLLKKEWMKSPDNPLNQRHAFLMAAKGKD